MNRIGSSRSRSDCLGADGAVPLITEFVPVSDCVAVMVAVPASGTAGGGRIGCGVRVGARPGWPLSAGRGGRSVGAATVLFGVTPGAGGGTVAVAGAGAVLVGWGSGVPVDAGGMVLLGNAVGVAVALGSAVSVAVGVGWASGVLVATSVAVGVGNGELGLAGVLGDWKSKSASAGDAWPVKYRLTSSANASSARSELRRVTERFMR